MTTILIVLILLGVLWLAYSEDRLWREVRDLEIHLSTVGNLAQCASDESRQIRHLMEDLRDLDV